MICAGALDEGLRETEHRAEVAMFAMHREGSWLPSVRSGVVMG